MSRVECAGRGWRGERRVRWVRVVRRRMRLVGPVAPAGAVPPEGLAMLAARHSRLGDVRATLLNAGDATTSLIPGDTLGLEFSATPIPAGQVRDFFLLSRGVYTSGTTQLASRPEPASAPPTSLALHQNRPNP